MNSKRALLLIPARYESSRFPGKPLALIRGRPMIQRVYERLSLAGKTSDSVQFDLFVVTDNNLIKNTVEGFGGRVHFVSDETSSGTERIALAYERFHDIEDYDLVINVQGDEPLICHTIIESLANFHLSRKFDITTIVRPNDVDEVNPNTVKAIYCKSNSRCLYFSRAEIPFNRSNDKNLSYAHVGIYSYSPKSLQLFTSFDQGVYEKIEMLEQLRALENGQSIGAIEVNAHLQGVDVPEDIAKVEEFLDD